MVNLLIVREGNTEYLMYTVSAT